MIRIRNTKPGALTYRRGAPGALIVLALLATAPASAGQQNGRAPWPRRVLVTNDNGIDDRATLALARALARVADTYLVASADDRSGSSNLLTVTRTGEFRVERREAGEGVHAWAIHGTPADAVVFALTGPMRDSLPDLIVSGINGGSNLADDWLGSGTIGAVRTGSYFGVPGVAVSGVDDDDSTAVRVVVDWVVRAGRIAIVPMRVDEYDDMLARKICDGSAAPLPRWTASAGDSTEGGVKCAP